MRLYYRTADRQPHASALRFSGKEWGENLIGFPGGQAHTGIADRDHELGILTPRADRNLSRRRQVLMASILLSMWFIKTCCN
jgi:hypothetical protein